MRPARRTTFRARRWHARWHKADGLVLPGDAARARLAAHVPSARGYTVTALERYAQCPYRFYLSAVVGLRKQQTPEPIETLSSQQRGDLTHEALYALLTDEEKKKIPEQLLVWLRYRSEKYFGEHRTAPGSTRK